MGHRDRPRPETVGRGRRAFVQLHHARGFGHTEVTFRNGATIRRALTTLITTPDRVLQRESKSSRPRSVSEKRERAPRINERRRLPAGQLPVVTFLCPRGVPFGGH